MKRKRFVNVMVLVSMVYGATIGILAMVHSPGLGLASIIGAIAVGLGWTAMGMFTRPEVQK